MQLAQELLKDDLEHIESRFRQYLTSDVPLIREMGDYILASGGKRIRPVLLLLCSRLCGYGGEHRFALASVIEFIHTATLLHDDVVDGATLRRGKASANVTWGNEVAVLVGDYLFARCFELMVDFCDRRIMKVLAATTSTMAQGEVVQLTNSGDISLDEDRYLDVVRRKTAALFSATCRCAGILAGLEASGEEDLAAFGMHLGVAFQLIDDALDYIADQSESGKVLGRDLAEGKMTLPLIHTLRQCDDNERQNIAAIIAKGDLAEKDLAMVQDMIARYDSIAYTRQQADLYAKKACARLDAFPPSAAKQALEDLAASAARRRF